MARRDPLAYRQGLRWIRTIHVANGITIHGTVIGWRHVNHGMHICGQHTPKGIGKADVFSAHPQAGMQQQAAYRIING
jgi:hypothetical protein